MSKRKPRISAGKLVPGQLSYLGKVIDIIKFVNKDIDFRYLVGRCTCGGMLHGKLALPIIDKVTKQPIIACNKCFEGIAA